jgi:hypothetical protein
MLYYHLHTLYLNVRRFSLWVNHPNIFEVAI